MSNFYTGVTILTVLGMIVMSFVVYANYSMPRRKKIRFVIAYAMISMGAILEWGAMMLETVNSSIALHTVVKAMELILAPSIPLAIMMALALDRKMLAPMVAVVRCNGTCGNRPKTNEYDGSFSCKVKASLYSGDTGCAFGCLGCGDCVEACKFGALSMNPETGLPVVDESKCTACGACVYQCPFGAIMDKSYILNVIDLIKKSEQNEKYKVYALVAPSISSQFTYAKLGQVIAGLKTLGFFTVIEAALGADMVAYAESKELVEKGFLTSSCCPAFVGYVHKSFPALVPLISHNLSPMATIARYIKSTDQTAKIVFIGPCTAKKAEVQKEAVKPYVDVAITFEELQALFDSGDLDITMLNEDVLDNASYFGRIFARSGGLSDAVAQGLKEQGVAGFELKAVPCDGIEACRVALLKKSKNALDGNFIEGMACIGGCIGGAGCLTHGEKNKAEVDKYGMEAYEKTITEAISVLK